MERVRLYQFEAALAALPVTYRASALRTLMAYQRPPRGVGTPRALSASAICRRVVAPVRRMSAMIGAALPAARSASALMAATAWLRAASMFGLPSTTPRAFAAASADLVRPEISDRSFSASAPRTSAARTRPYTSHAPDTGTYGVGSRYLRPVQGR
jgi:hypothetical protein